MDSENPQPSALTNGWQRIIALGIIFAFLYWASSVLIALLLAVLVAFFLDPAVKMLDRIHVPRAVGAVLVMLAAGSALGVGGYLLTDRLESFAGNWPEYSAIVKRAAQTVDSRLTLLDKQFSQIAPVENRGRAAVRVEDSQPVRTFLLKGLGSIYAGMLVWAFLPFLVFFMLAGKKQIWLSTLDLFPSSSRNGAREALEQVSAMLRQYIAGLLFVGAILVSVTWAFFWAMHLNYPFLAALVSGSLNLVPYLGALLAWLPPFLIGMAQWKTITPFVGVAAGLTILHLLAGNLLMPAIIGRRVHLNALSVTISLLFWGWLWGAIGLLLAIPIMATIKVVCDHVQGWEAAGRWLAD